MECKTKVYIHQEQIDKVGQQALFQMKLPRNASSIIAVLITAKSFINNSPGMGENKFGAITLRLNEQVDVFHSEDVYYREVLQVFQPLNGVFPSLGFGAFDYFSPYGFPLQALSIDLDKKQKFIQAYYQDQSPQGYSVSYQLSTYIYYNTTE